MAWMKCEKCPKKIHVPNPDAPGATRFGMLGAGMVIGVHLMDHRATCDGKVYDWPTRHPDGLSFEERLGERLRRDFAGEDA